MAKNKLIIGNWKCNPVSYKKAEILLRVSDRKNVVVCPPFPFLDLSRQSLEEAGLGAQDLFWEEGAHTGEVSARQLKDIGVKYCIIGHSERRAMGETDLDVKNKVKAAISIGIVPIICVGEPASVRKKGMPSVKRYVAAQVKAVAGVISGKKAIFAYEPIWAIGTGVTASPDDAEMMSDHIRTSAGSKKMVVLYGGSVNSANVAEFLSREGVDGALVGGASADPREFSKLLSVVAGMV